MASSRYASVHLEGATQLSFGDARHGHIGANWYGADPVVDRWWPTAETLWQGALEARRTPAGKATEDPLTLFGAGGLELEVAGWSSGSSSGS